jgi:hypothetical protein
MDKRGVTTFEMLAWLIGVTAAAITYIHATFTTYREVIPRLDRIEAKIDDMIKVSK